MGMKMVEVETLPCEPGQTRAFRVIGIDNTHEFMIGDELNEQKLERLITSSGWRVRIMAECLA